MNWVGETISHPIVSMALSSLPDAGEPVVITIEDASGGVRTLDPMWYTVGNDGILLSMPIERRRPCGSRTHLVRYLEG